MFRCPGATISVEGGRLIVAAGGRVTAGALSFAMAGALARVLAGERVDLIAEGVGAVERERQFAVTVGRAFTPVATSHIVQGYFDVAGATFRVRRKDRDWLLTLKTGDGLSRGELEEPVDAEIGEAVMRAAGPHTVEKRRHRHGGWEIDEYLGRFAGRAKAEYELPAEESDVPPLPDGIALLREVTGLRGFSDRALALNGRYPDL